MTNQINVPSPIIHKNKPVMISVRYFDDWTGFKEKAKYKINSMGINLNKILIPIGSEGMKKI